MGIEPATADRLKRAKQQLWEAHRGDPNFTGCGIGFRFRGGKRTSEPVVIAMVADKIPAAALSQRRLLPATMEVDGETYGVDVVEVGPVFGNSRAVSAQPATISSTGPITGNFRPPPQGAGISNVDADISQEGTIGCFVFDLTDFTSCILSANHVIARCNEADIGEVIIQPALVDHGSSGTDGIAKVKRFVPFDFSSDNNLVDVAIAALDDQTVSGMNQDFYNELMPQIDVGHPAVGMVVASDSFGSCFLSRMDHTVTAMNVQILNWTGDGNGTIEPQVGMNIEKVGRTSGYTSCPIDAIAVTVPVNFDGVDVVMSDMIWTQFFSEPGDSGAVACQGGNGHVVVQPPSAPCPFMSAVQGYYALPAPSADNTLTNSLQTKFLSQTLTGNLVIGMVYMNSQMVINRLAADSGPDFNQATAQAYVQTFYAKYRPVIAAMLANPDSLVFTMDQVNDSEYLIELLGNPPSEGGQGILTTPEYDFGAILVLFLFAFMQDGYGYTDLFDFMNRPDVYNQMVTQAAAVPTFELP